VSEKIKCERRRFLRNAAMAIAAIELGLPASAAESHPRLTDQGPSPGFGAAAGWLNSAPLDRKALRGKVVLVNFWTYSCINSLRELPYMKSWAANYFIDGKGRIRFHHFGEGAYADSERVIQELLKENGATGLDESTVNISGGGVEAPPGEDLRSPETYAGYRRAERFASPERLAQDSRRTYTPPATPSLNQWGLGGVWTAEAERAVLQTGPGKIVFRFHSRDLHMVLGPQKNGVPIRFRVKLDGVAPGGDCGSDCTPDGNGEVREPRLYQLIRQKGRVKEWAFEIELLDPGVQAFSFTFG